MKLPKTGVSFWENVLMQGLRSVSMVACFIVFATWSIKALYKLEHKPVGSSVTFRNGDDNFGGISYPIVTFCRKNFQDMYYAPQVKSRCCCPPDVILSLFPPTWDTVLEYCFSHDQNPFSSVEESTVLLTNATLMKGLNNFKFPSIIAVDFPNFFLANADSYLYSFYMKKFGKCFSFDLAYFSNDKYYPLQDVTVEFNTNDIGSNITNSEFIVAIHELPQDRIEALTRFAFTLSPGHQVTVRAKKQVLKAISSKEAPCTNVDGYNIKYCELLQQEAIFYKKFNCQLPWMNQPLWPNVTILDVQPCPIFNESNNFTIYNYAMEWRQIENNNVTFEACPKFPRCSRAFYDTTESSQALADPKKGDNSVFVLRHVTNTVQTIIDSYTYDEQSFIGEVGGTLGLMLGYSCMSIIDLFEYVLHKLTEKCTTKK